MLATLEALERALFDPELRHDAMRLDALLHPDFVEFGRSGSVLDKAAVLRLLPAEDPSPRIVAEDFALVALGPQAALLTYRSAHLGADGRRARETLRSSVWLREGETWRLRFHQGTATGEVPR